VHLPVCRTSGGPTIPSPHTKIAKRGRCREPGIEFPPQFDEIYVPNFGLCGNFYICDEAYFVAFKLETERQGRHPRLLAFCTAAIGEHGHFYGFYMLLVVVMQEHDMWETISYARVN
jgi:hypothetical protein